MQSGCEVPPIKTTLLGLPALVVPRFRKAIAETKSINNKKKLALLLCRILFLKCKLDDEIIKATILVIYELDLLFLVSN